MSRPDNRKYIVEITHPRWRVTHYDFGFARNTRSRKSAARYTKKDAEETVRLLKRLDKEVDTVAPNEQPMFTERKYKIVRI